MLSIMMSMSAYCAWPRLTPPWYVQCVKPATLEPPPTLIGKKKNSICALAANATLSVIWVCLGVFAVWHIEHTYVPTATHQNVCASDKKPAWVPKSDSSIIVVPLSWNTCTCKSAHSEGLSV